MKLEDKIKELNEAKEKAKFTADSLQLWQDYRSLIASGNNLIKIVNNCVVTDSFVVDVTNNILNVFCNKYGFNYKCENRKNFWIILNNAAGSMMNLAQNKFGEEILKEFFKKLM